MKKVAFYVADFSGGGAERVLINFANTLVSFGYIVDFVVTRLKGDYQHLLRSEINVVNLNAISEKKSVFPLANYLKQNKPNVLISTLTQCNQVAVLAKLLSFSSVKLILREANSFFGRRVHKSKWKVLIERIRLRLIYQWANEIIANSIGSASDLEKALFFKKGKVRLILNPVNFQKIIELSHGSINENINSFLNSHGKSKVFLGIGRLEQSKGFDNLIKSFAKLKTDKAVLIILGEGGLRNELEQLCTSLSINDRVLLAGFTKNPYSVLKKADCFVLSSHFEGMPNVLLEALTLRIQIIATKCPHGPEEILENGMLGKLVKVNDTESLTEAMSQVLKGDFTKEVDDEFFEIYAIQKVTKDLIQLF
jgi:glycosyltransferase involved in cell wall biosynthesis